VRGTRRPREMLTTSDYAYVCRKKKKERERGRSFPQVSGSKNSANFSLSLSSFLSSVFSAIARYYSSSRSFRHPFSNLFIWTRTSRASGIRRSFVISSRRESELPRSKVDACPEEGISREADIKIEERRPSVRPRVRRGRRRCH